MSARYITWKELVAETLRKIGGQGHLREIYELIEGTPKTATNPTWRDTIRRVLRQYAIFEPVPPERSGVYRLRQGISSLPEDIPTARNHITVQGLLVRLGEIYGYETYVPPRDQHTNFFQEKQLGEIITIKDCSDLFHGPNLSKIREIDVIWFDEDDYGPFPAYAFEVEHSTKVKAGMDRLLKIPRRFAVDLFVVGPGEEERKMFNRFVAQSPFSDYKSRFAFRDYDEVEALYQNAKKHKILREAFGVMERWQRKWWKSNS